MLTDATDAEVCRKLRDGIKAPEYLTPAWALAFYGADGFYFLTATQTPYSETHIKVENDVLTGWVYKHPFAAFGPSVNLLYSGVL